MLSFKYALLYYIIGSVPLKEIRDFRFLLKLLDSFLSDWD